VQKIVLKKKILHLLQTSVIANNIIDLRKDVLNTCLWQMSNVINFNIVGRMGKCILYLFSSPINVEIE